MQAIPKDGKTIGEVMMRGNMVMKGYYKNKKKQMKLLHKTGFILEI